MEDWFIMIEPLWLKPSKIVIATIAFWGQMTIYRLYIITFIKKGATIKQYDVIYPPCLLEIAYNEGVL